MSRRLDGSVTERLGFKGEKKRGHSRGEKRGAGGGGGGEEMKGTLTAGNRCGAVWGKKRDSMHSIVAIIWHKKGATKKLGGDAGEVS